MEKKNSVMDFGSFAEDMIPRPAPYNPTHTNPIPIQVCPSVPEVSMIFPTYESLPFKNKTLQIKNSITSQQGSYNAWRNQAKIEFPPTTLNFQLNKCQEKQSNNDCFQNDILTWQQQRSSAPNTQKQEQTQNNKNHIPTILENINTNNHFIPIISEQNHTKVLKNNILPSNIDNDIIINESKEYEPNTANLKNQISILEKRINELEMLEVIRNSERIQCQSVFVLAHNLALKLDAQNIEINKLRNEILANTNKIKILDKDKENNHHNHYNCNNASKADTVQNISEPNVRDVWLLLNEMLQQSKQQTTNNYLNESPNDKSYDEINTKCVQFNDNLSVFEDKKITDMSQATFDYMSRHGLFASPKSKGAIRKTLSENNNILNIQEIRRQPKFL